MRSTALIYKSISANQPSTLRSRTTILKRNISFMDVDYLGPFADPYDPLNPINQVMIQNQKNKDKEKQEKKAEKQTPPKPEDNNSSTANNRTKPGCDY